MFLWKLDKEFIFLKGDRVKRFVLTGPATADLLSECLEEDAIVLLIVKGLCLWYEVERFLKNREHQIRVQEEEGKRYHTH